MATELKHDSSYTALVLLDDGTTGTYCGPSRPCIGDSIVIEAMDDVYNRINYEGLLGMILKENAMKDVECPYCGADIEIDHDGGYGYEENELHQQDCPECGQAFVYETSISFTYAAYSAPCLNGEPHDYSMTLTYPPEFAHLRCNICGEDKES